MKAYLDAKAEAAKNTIFNFPATVKAWPGKKWASTKHKMNTTDWPVTITYFIGWAIRQSVQGALFGMGTLAFLLHVAAWDSLVKKDLGDDPVPMEAIYDLIGAGLIANFTFAMAGILACMVITSSSLRLHRLDGHDFDDEASRILREAVEKLDQKKPV